MFRKLYIAFLNELSKLAKKHDEITDTDVRERLHEVIDYYFVWGKPMKGFPKRFAMMTRPADRAVAAIVKKFIVHARRLADDAELKVGAPRHALLEDPAAKTRRGETYDLFLGSADELQRASKPAPDSVYARVAKKKKYRPAYAPQELAIKFAGEILIPTFDAENAFWEYEYRGRTTGWHQDYFWPKELRKLARDALNGKDCPLGVRKPIR